MAREAWASGLILSAWILAGIYVGTAGLSKASFEEALESAPKDGETVEFEGVEYQGVEQLRVAIMQQRARRYFGWALDLPSIAALILAAAAFGAVGGATRVVALLTMTPQPLTLRIVLLDPLFGALIGIMLLGVAYALPAALTTGSATTRPLSLLFLCLLGGAFAEKVYHWIGSRLGSIGAEGPNGGESGES